MKMNIMTIGEDYLGPMPKGVVELLINMDKHAHFYAFYCGMVHTFKTDIKGGLKYVHNCY